MINETKSYNYIILMQSQLRQQSCKQWIKYPCLLWDGFAKTKYLAIRFAKTKYLAWWMEGRMDGWMDGWKVAEAGLRIAYSNQKLYDPLYRKTTKLSWASKNGTISDKK